ncbi:MAG: hypothetical protein P0Y55_02820 [Candidatus Cohnella colombiensis]|uniref:Uncharacterized protein n=1 Tax=Candidatus Cohnella colombiensis TaxID=3121368 RepID=A0AA95EY44_9BACL|nr:MAG: hypothetical protein P0Y55_02820 [Cohnella sp.]
MKVTTGMMVSYPKLSDVQEHKEKPLLQSGVHLPRPEVYQDLLEISDQARQIAADINHELVKVNIPDRPIGAPDDYIPVSELMRRFDPQNYEKMNQHFGNNESEKGLLLLIDFTKKLPLHPDWIEKYREELQQPVDDGFSS